MVRYKMWFECAWNILNLHDAWSIQLSTRWKPVKMISFIRNRSKMFFLFYELKYTFSITRASFTQAKALSYKSVTGAFHKLASILGIILVDSSPLEVGWLGLTSDLSYVVGYCRCSRTHPKGWSGDILSGFWYSTKGMAAPLWYPQRYSLSFENSFHEL